MRPELAARKNAVPRFPGASTSAYSGNEPAGPRRWPRDSGRRARIPSQSGTSLGLLSPVASDLRPSRLSISVPDFARPLRRPPSGFSSSDAASARRPDCLAWARRRGRQSSAAYLLQFSALRFWGSALRLRLLEGPWPPTILPLRESDAAAARTNRCQPHRNSAADRFSYRWRG